MEQESRNKERSAGSGWIGGTRIHSLGTLLSRLLGMLRDIATASVLGMSAGGVMDAFVLAFRIPNLFRRLFGEGALTASFLPIFLRVHGDDPRRGWQLAGTLAVFLATFLAVVVMIGELVCLSWLLWIPTSGQVRLFLQLMMILMPYLVLICLAAQAAAILHSLRHFTIPALMPSVLNVVWLVVIWGIAPRVSMSPEGQSRLLALGVVLGGALQLGLQLPVLRRLGVEFGFAPRLVWPELRTILWGMLPMVLGLLITQLNTLLDSLIAWGFSGPPESIPWVGNGVVYPMRVGAVAAIYYGERLYQFPLGLLGIAVATAIFPLLSRHAAAEDHRSFRDDLTLGLRLVFALGIPAGVGLVLLSGPLARLLFLRGAFTPDDARRTADMIATYALGVWAYCAIPVIVRAYYASSDRMLPVKVGLGCTLLNLVLNLLLIWPFAERGLAVATSGTAALQLLLLTFFFSRKHAALPFASLAGTFAEAVVASGLMGLAVFAALWGIFPDATGKGADLIRVLGGTLLGAGTYLMLSRLMGLRELVYLMLHPRKPEKESP